MPVPVDARELQGCVRDLVALSTMPAWWIGRSPEAIAESVRDLLVSMLRADSVTIRLHGRYGRKPSESTMRPPGTLDEREAGTRSRARARAEATTSTERGASDLRFTTLPIGLDGELGQVQVGAARPDFPQRLELLLVQVAANQVSVALQHADLLVRHERAERSLAARAAQQAMVAHLGLRALHAIAAKPMLAEAVTAIRDTMRADHCEIAELSADEQTLTIRALDGWPVTMLDATLPVTRESVHGRAVITTLPVVVRDLRRDRRFASPSLLHDRRVVSAATVVIDCPRGRFGVLGVHSDAPREFTADDVHFLQSVASLLAAAVERLSIEAERETLLARTAAAQAEAERASSVKSQFLGIMSHELRTPLNAIGGYAQLLEEEVRGPITAEQRADLGRIKRSQKHLLSVIENVLGFLKLGSGQMRYDIEVVSVEEIVAAAEELTRPLITSKRLHFAYRPLGDGLWVRADRGKLQQILVNLLSNATKFTDAEGHVSIECAPANAMVELRVVDTGCGIPTDRLQSVFDPFVQVVEADRQRAGQGTGLGLSISRDFAAGMGGRLLASSELGKGSTFTIVLPRAAPHEAGRRAQGPPSIPAS
jgi:signal transduction histidine kinase